MGEKIGKVKVDRKPKNMYYTKGDPISIYRRDPSTKKNELVLNTKVARASGYLYYVDREGYLCRAAMKHGKK